MKRTILMAIAVLMLGATAARAQEKTPPAPAPMMPAMPKPGPEVERLSYFVGAWTTAGHIKPSPLGDGGDAKGRDSCGWMPGKFFVGCMIQSESPMGRVQTEGILGWDPDKKLYSWSTFDSMGRHETASGTFDNGAWTFLGETKMGDKMMKTRYVISDTKPEGYDLRWETSPDGKEWKSLMEGKVAKMQSAMKPATPAAALTPVVTPGKS